MKIQIDFRSGIPIYIQIMDQVKHLVASGKLGPDDQLPTVRQLASELRVNFNTVARAYRILDEAGIISTQHGRGTYLLSPPSPASTARIRHEALEALTNQFLARAAQLDYTPEEVKETVDRFILQWNVEGKAPDNAFEK